MTVPDDTRPESGASTSCVPPLAVARCEGCGLVHEVDVLGASVGGQLGDCEDCGSPLYVLGPGDVAVFLAGYGAGWDACGAFVAEVVTEAQLDELTPDVTVEEIDGGGDCWCVAGCGNCEGLHR